MPALRVAELETLFTANTKPMDEAEKKIQTIGKRVESKPIKQKVDADTREAIASMDRVEATGKRIVSAKTVATVDANIERAEKSFMRVYERLDYLKTVDGELEVTADIRRAEASLSKIQRSLDGLRAVRHDIEVNADIRQAEGALDDLGDKAEDAGAEGGARGGEALVAGIVGALASIPIVGAIAGIAETVATAVGEAFQEGLQVEAGFDELQALTGVDEATALRLGRAAGEAYANVFGESIEANMDTARLALQFRILDPESTGREAQQTISHLAGIADVLDEDVARAAETVAVMLKSGITQGAGQAFDILATGARNGVNRSQDLLDTFTEYPTLFKRLGLSGEEALGLISQGMRNGARNSDLVADALKELQIRSTDASETSAEGYRLIGLNAEEMTAKMAAGGEGAREGLDQILDGLRAIEDPVARNVAGVALVGTQWEDLGDSILALDLSTAVEELGGVEGAAQRMFDTLADNDATKLEQAQRNVEVAMQGIQGALAAGFAEPLAEAADWVSQNRGPLMQFFLDLADGALDFGLAIVEGAAVGTEAFGEFVSGPLADVAEGLAGVMRWFGQHEQADGIQAMVDEMRGFEDTTSVAADAWRENLTGAIEDARDRMHEFADPAVALGYLNDASLQLADSIAAIGDGSASTQSQAVAAVEALNAQIEAARNAGESQETLDDRYAEGTEAIVQQMIAMGWNEEAARRLVEQYGRIPGSVNTVVTATTAPAAAAVNGFIRAYNGSLITLRVGAQGQQTYSRDGGNTFYEARGGVLEYMAAGGLTPMDPIAQMVPPNTWRVVGDRGDVAEAYIPLDGSQRSLAILLEAMRRMGVGAMADGGITPGGDGSMWRGGDIYAEFNYGAGIPAESASRATLEDLRELLRGS